MPCSNRHIMNELARGRPMPHGQPEPHLYRALERMDSMGISQAVHMGARVDVPDGRSRSSAHILLDAAMTPQGEFRQDPRRLLACIRELVRNNANFNLPHPATRMTAVGRMAPLVGTVIGAELAALLRPRIQWSARISPDGPTAKQAWDDAMPPKQAPAVDDAAPPAAPSRPRVR